MNRQYNQVRDLHLAFDVDMADSPTMLSRGEGNECKHVAKALNELVGVMKDINSDGRGGDVMRRVSWVIEELVEVMQSDTFEDQVDGLTDAAVFLIGAFTVAGLDPEPFFDIVMRSNMGKLGPDGKAIKDKQGKYLKPEGWAEKYAPEPLIVQEIARQSAMCFRPGD